VKPWTLRSGQVVRVRPIRPEDEDKVVQFHRSLSEESVYLRFASAMHLTARTAHERLSRICFIDYAREMALVAELESADRAGREIVGIGRLTRVPGTGDGEFAMLISDKHQRQGLGTELLQRLFIVGRDWGLERIFAEILPRNFPMQKVCKALGFELDSGGAMVRAVKTL
jgi:acetyltransferase